MSHPVRVPRFLVTRSAGLGNDVPEYQRLLAYDLHGAGKRLSSLFLMVGAVDAIYGGTMVPTNMRNCVRNDYHNANESQNLCKNAVIAFGFRVDRYQPDIKRCASRRHVISVI